MPEITGNHDVNRNGSYQFDQNDWPSSPSNLRVVLDFSLQVPATDSLDSLRLWNCALPVDTHDEERRSFLENICAITNSDIKKFNSSAHQLIESDITDHDRVHEERILEKLACSWNLLLRLRLVCDVAIILWANSPKNTNPPTNPTDMDCIGRLLADGDAQSSLQLTPGACACLKVINEAANGIKHPIDPNNVVIHDDINEILISRKGISHKIFQPIQDIVVGVNYFLIAALSKIKI